MMRVFVVHDRIVMPSDGTTYERGERVVRVDHNREIEQHHQLKQRCVPADHADVDDVVIEE